MNQQRRMGEMARAMSSVGWCVFAAAALCLPAGCTGSEMGPGGLVTPAETSNPDATLDAGEVQEDTTNDTSPTDVAGDSNSDVDTQQASDGSENPDADTSVDISTDADTTSDTGSEEDAEVDPGPEHLCNTDDDCVDEDACTESTCELLEEGYKDCVHLAIDCDMGDPCLTPGCDAKDGCVYEVASAEGCCFGSMIQAFDFEEEVPEMAVTNLATEGFPEAIWSVAEQRSYTGSKAAYFGIPDQLTYDNGSLVAAEVTLPPVSLPSGARSELNFHLWADVEPGDSWDVLIVGIQGDDQSLPAWVKNYDNVEMQTWQHITVDLAAFTGQTVQITFTFNSIDHTYNDSEGLYIDDVWIWTGCGSLSCEDEVSCNDDIACTSDACIAGSCAYATGDACCVVDADCFDGDNCTVDYCLNFACENQPVANPDCCNTDAECDDGNTCTVDTCAPGSEYLCAHEVSSDVGCCETAAQCDDGDPCTIDKCTDFQCDHVNTCCFSDLECDDNDDVCTVDTCVEGACLYEIQEVEGCCDPEPLDEDFEGSSPISWSFDGGGGGCMWQTWAGGQSKSESTALYYGNIGSNSFNCGETSGNALLGPITLQSGVGLAFETQVWMDTEAGSFYDKLELHIKTPTGAGTLWTKGFISTQTWFKVSADLSAFAGQTIYLEWYFNTGDDFINDGQGVFIDDMQITSTCQGVGCQVTGDCGDGLSFTGDACEGGYCAWTTP